jgi:hypothetical protein
MSVSVQLVQWPPYSEIIPHVRFLSDGRHTAVGIAARYGLYDPGIESRWGGGEWRFSAPVKTGPVALLASYTLGTGFFPGVKRPGRVVNHPTPLEPRLKKE